MKGYVCCLILLFFFNPELATARTFKTDDFTKDKNVDYNHKFGIFSPVEKYEDPDFAEALALPSPLFEENYQSYDIIIMANLNTKIDPTTRIIEPGQRLRIYVRPNVFEEIGWERFHFDNNSYDPQIGLLYYWKISSAKEGKITPLGHFRPEHFSSDNRSANYDLAPMPWSVFFRLGLYATHGTSSSAIPILGTKASGGCIRIETQRAKDIFHLIGFLGKGQVDIIERDGRLRRFADGSVAQELNYRALFIIK